jgi:hypothetical protein
MPLTIGSADFASGDLAPTAVFAARIQGSAILWTSVTIERG